MRKLILQFGLTLLIAFNLQAQELTYYLPDSVSYNPAIPTPKDVIFHEVGEWHVTHDRLTNYMQALAAVSDRVKLETMGFTYEDRPQTLLIITSPENQARLEEIRQQHLKLSDPNASAGLNVDEMPIVLYIGHSIHGNESSGSNAALLSAYYLAAAQGPQIDDLLKHTIILFDPSFNPDGLQRFSTWANQHKSKNLVSDPASREYHEVWPGGRYNHYWFDLNRDWLPAVHRESQHRLEWFHRWKPNILTDHHEQGSDATFFFQPGVPARVNPLTPNRNQELTEALAKYHAAYLDRIGSLYFSKESYDDYYYGKGSTYPDINGAIGILFEQASSRGHVQETANGLLRFPATIRNQFTTTLSTLEGARQLRKEFLNWQREFYKQAIAEASRSSVKAYVYDAAKDPEKSAIFTDMLLRQQIKVYPLAKNVSLEGNKYSSGKAYVVPLEQSQYRVIEAIFRRTHEYKDSLFYDITAWTLPLAFDLDYSSVTAAQQSGLFSGTPLERPIRPTGNVNARSEYAYAFDWSPFLSARALYFLQDHGLRTKVANDPFTVNDHEFSYGSIMVPVAGQSISSDSIYKLMQQVAAANSFDIYGLTTGASVSGAFLGSRSFETLQKPSIALLVGSGVSALDAGEIWHLLDQRFDIPVTQLDQEWFNRVSLDRYNVIIMVSGSYSDLSKEKLQEWVRNGGTLVLLEEAIRWGARNGLSKAKFRQPEEALQKGAHVPYASRSEISGAQQMSGAIFETAADLTHPLAYGYTDPLVPMFKANRVYIEKTENPFATPFIYGADPLMSGWVSQQNLAALKGCAAVTVDGLGRGKVINIADDPNFRAFWLGGSRLMLNSLFFGQLISGAAAE